MNQTQTKETTDQGNKPRSENRPRYNKKQGGRRYRRRTDFFKENPDVVINYKDVKVLVRFVTPKGKILPRRLTGLSAANQRKVAKAIKQARHAGLLPYNVS